jgi:hypothetical protein
MKYKLIPTEEYRTEMYILVVDDSDIKEGDFIYDLDIKRIVIADDLKVATSKAPLCWYYKKIISHTPLNGAPYFDGLDVLPPNWRDNGEDVDKLAREEILYNDDKREWWKQGYNKAREKNQNDLIKTLMGFDLEIKKLLLKYPEIEHSLHARMCDDINDVRGMFIQSIQQPKLPIAFECETERVFKHNEHMEREYYDVPKTIINAGGRKEWVGKYIYE